MRRDVELYGLFIMLLCMLKEWTMNETRALKLKITKYGRYGKNVRLERGSRFIAFSPNVWLRFRHAVPRLRTMDHVVYMTEEKSVTVIEFQETRYVSFLYEARRANGEVVSTFINLNDDEYQQLLSFLPEIDAIIPPVNTEQCECVKRMVKLCTGQRMVETTLNEEQLQNVIQNNQDLGNQEGSQCTFCGAHDRLDDTCHCHTYDCRLCEPKNFCDICGENMILGF